MPSAVRADSLPPLPALTISMAEADEGPSVAAMADGGETAAAAAGPTGEAAGDGGGGGSFLDLLMDDDDGFGADPTTDPPAPDPAGSSSYLPPQALPYAPVLQTVVDYVTQWEQVIQSLSAWLNERVQRWRRGAKRPRTDSGPVSAVPSLIPAGSGQGAGVGLLGGGVCGGLSPQGMQRSPSPVPTPLSDNMSLQGHQQQHAQQQQEGWGGVVQQQGSAEYQPDAGVHADSNQGVGLMHLPPQPAMHMPGGQMGMQQHGGYSMPGISDLGQLTSMQGMSGVVSLQLGAGMSMHMDLSGSMGFNSMQLPSPMGGGMAGLSVMPGMQMMGVMGGGGAGGMGARGMKRPPRPIGTNPQRRPLSSLLPGICHVSERFAIRTCSGSCWQFVMGRSMAFWY